MPFVVRQECPGPVARYFASVLEENQRLIRAAHVIQQGEMRMAPGKDWKRFEARQYFAVDPPGYVWEAGWRVVPMVRVHVRDAYYDGEGSTEASVLGLLPLFHQRALPELNTGALQRYLAEAIWFPTALIPGNGVEWTSVDETRARATFRDCDIIASLYFHFNDTGEICAVSTPGRYRQVGRKYEWTPWTVFVGNYREQSGIRIPMEVEVEWLLPEGPFCWFRANVLQVRYEFE